MNMFRIIALILVSVLLVPLMCTLLVGISLGCSVFSPAFADVVFNRSFTDKSIEAMATGSDGMPEAIGAMLQSRDGASWAKTELPKLVKGSYRSFVTDGGKLPTVNIKPLKTALVDAYLEKALSGGGSDAASAKQLIKSQLGIDTMKDSLDLNTLTQNTYGDKDNPVSGFGSMISGVSTNLFFLNIALVIVLMALAGVIAFRSETALRWIGSVFAISGLVCLLPAAAALIFSGAIQQSLTKSMGMEAGSFLFIRDWIMSFLSGAALFLLIGGIVVLVAGILMRSAANRTGRGAHSSSRKQGSTHVGARAVAAVLLVVAIPAAFYFFGKTVYLKTDKYNTVVRMADRSEKKMSFGRALDKTLNSKLFGKVLK